MDPSLSPDRSDLWQARLQHAIKPADVVSISNEYIASWPAPAIAKLPADCRPDFSSEPDEVASMAFRLVQQQRLYSNNSSELDRMANFFADASARLSQIIAE